MDARTIGNTMNDGAQRAELAALASPRPSASNGRVSFAGELQRAESAATAGEDRDTRLRQAAEQLVSSAFVLPMLQQLRDSPFKSELLGNTTGEKVFGQRLDTELADRITASPSFPLVDTIVEHLNRKAGRTVGPGGIDTHG